MQNQQSFAALKGFFYLLREINQEKIESDDNEASVVTMSTEGTFSYKAIQNEIDFTSVISYRVWLF